MDSFFGRIAANSAASSTRFEGGLSNKDATFSTHAQASSSSLSIGSTEQWAVRTTPVYHCFAAGYVLHADLGFLDAHSAARVLSDKGVDALRGSDGCYVAARLNRLTNEFSLFCDPLATRPVFYQQVGDQLAFASQAKWLAGLCGVARQLNAGGMLQFLMNRYPVGYDSLFLGAVRLPPGHMLRFNPMQGALEVRRYWDLKFDSGIHSMTDAMENLHEVFLESHAAVFDELRSAADPYRLFLTGGMDSRGILGYAQRLGYPPSLAQTWGETDLTPESDPVIARQLADSVGVPFEFCEVKAEDWVEHAAEWAWRGELQSDNANSYATVLNFFSRPNSPAFRFSVAGDQMLGAGPLPSTIDQATDNILHSAMQMAGGPLSLLLKPESHQAMLSSFRSGVQNLVDQCPNSHPKDLQDYLYFHTYISRWILAPGNFKHPVISVRRPLMTMAVINSSRHLAPNLRVDKAAYIHLLQREFPQLMAIPKMATESGVSWSYHSRTTGKLRNELVRLTRPEKLESLIIHDALDMDAVQSFLWDFFDAEPVSTTEGGRLQRSLYNVRRRVSGTPMLSGIANSLQPLVKRLAGVKQAEDRRFRYELVMRLALLTLFEEQFHSRDRR